VSNPDWWERAIAGECSHGGHGWDGDTCDEGPAGFCDDDNSEE